MNRSQSQSAEPSTIGWIRRCLGVWTSLALDFVARHRFQLLGRLCGSLEDLELCQQKPFNQWCFRFSARLVAQYGLSTYQFAGTRHQPNKHCVTDEYLAYQHTTEENSGVSRSCKVALIVPLWRSIIFFSAFIHECLFG